MSRLYLRDTTILGYTAGDRSVSKPGGVLSNTISQNNRMTVAKGTSQVLMFNQSSNPTTAHQDGLMAAFISDPISVSQVDANVWTIAVAVAEANANANAFLALTIYVVKADNTIRGYIYDAENIPGTTEFPISETGQIWTVSGAAVAGCVNTDRIVVEVWWHTTAQGMGTSYTRSLWVNGFTDIAQATATNDAASYLETPQNLFPSVSQNEEFFALI